MRVRRELQERARRDPAIGAVYATLDRLEGKTLLKSHERAGEDARGGRARRVFALTADGRRALALVQSTVARMSDGLDLRAPGKA
jgi:PadR family transcriptional regulator PadR